jgi:hypothetical protein
MIKLDQAGSAANLDKMPFANVPQDLADATTGFAGNGTAFTTSIVNLFILWNQQNTYIQQYRLTDAAVLYNQITNQLPLAQRQLSQIESSVADTGTYLNIDSLPADSDLASVYNQVLAKIQELTNMLMLLSRPLIPAQFSGALTPGNTGLTTAQIAALTVVQQAAILTSLLKSTALTLTVNPTTAYVGDAVNFSGTLSSAGQALADRQITLLVNNANILTVQTNNQGQFQGSFELPYLYINQMPVQVIYYPAGTDAGTYLAATSPMINMNVLFYTATLSLRVNGNAYPGKAAALTGTFNYGTAPVAATRSAAIYLDNNLEQQFNADRKVNLLTTLRWHSRC